MGLADKLNFKLESKPENEPEIEQLFEHDPEPGTPPRRRNATKEAVKSAPVRRTSTSNTKLAKEVGEDLTSLLEMTAVMWGMTDQCCAPVLEEQAKPIATSLAAILAKNPRLLQKFAQADFVSTTVQIAALGKALYPIGKAIYTNHVSKAVEDEGEGHEHERAGTVHLGAFPAFSGIARTHTS